MKSSAATPPTIAKYIAGFPPNVRSILRKVTEVVRNAAPEAEESISYRMPAFKQNGALVYFGAFKNHIGFFPPVSGDKILERALLAYRGEKGNLRFPLDQPIPYDLIVKIVKLRVKQNQLKASKKSVKVRSGHRR